MEKPKPSPKQYLVQEGDTLEGIAKRIYGDASRWRELASHNNIQSPRRLSPGEVLNIPRLD